MYYGKGYTGDYIGQLTFDEVIEDTRRLHEQMMEEKRAREEHARHVKSQMRTKRR